MRSSLDELIYDDLINVADIKLDVVASEESIRFLVDFYNELGKLENAKIVKKEQSLSFFEAEIKANIGSEQLYHRQVFMESGERSRLKQGDPDRVHYFALDFFISPGEKPLAIVFDHYNRFGAFYEKFSEAAQQLGIQFVVIGHTKNYYQTDSQRCPIFTCQHLLLTATDESYFSLIREHLTESQNNVTYLDWSVLPASYMENAQSFSTITNYVDTVIMRENIQPGAESPSLARVKFPQVLADSLESVKTEDDKTKTSYTKLINMGIRKKAIQRAGEAIAWFENKDNPDLQNTQKFIDLCYNEQYPLCHALLTTLVRLNGDNKHHAYFELIFNQAIIVEQCLKNPLFKILLNDKKIIELISQEKIEVFELFNRVTTRDTNMVLVDKQRCQTVVKNLTLVHVQLNNLPKVSSNELLDLLTDSQVQSKLLCKPLKALLDSGQITVTYFNQIDMSLIDKDKFEQIQDNAEKINYLDTQMQNQKVATEDEDDNLFGCFDVPSIEEVIPTSTSMSKPSVDVNFLANSMGKGVFGTPQHNREKDNAQVKPLLEEIKVAS